MIQPWLPQSRIPPVLAERIVLQLVLSLRVSPEKPVAELVLSFMGFFMLQKNGSFLKSKDLTGKREIPKQKAIGT